MEGGGVVLILSFFFIVSGLSAWAGWKDCATHWRNEAIKHRAASYVCNPQTGETVFKWKDEQ